MLGESVTNCVILKSLIQIWPPVRGDWHTVLISSQLASQCEASWGYTGAVFFCYLICTWLDKDYVLHCWFPPPFSCKELFLKFSSIKSNSRTWSYKSFPAEYVIIFTIFTTDFYNFFPFSFNPQTTKNPGQTGFLSFRPAGVWPQLAGSVENPCCAAQWGRQTGRTGSGQEALQAQWQPCRQLTPSDCLGVGLSVTAQHQPTKINNWKGHQG